jgi:hypothetical protein
MNKNRKAAALRACLAMLVAVGLLGGAGVALAQEKPAAAPVAPASEIKDERALKRLQAMSDTLAGAKTLRFHYRGLLPVTGPTGQYVNLMASASVVMQRPDRLRVQARGDLFPSDLFHDGKTVTVVAANPKVYAQREAAGSLVESFTRGPQPGGDLVTPFIDLLATDPFAVLTRDLTSAIWVGQSKVGGVVTDHLAFTSKDVDWEGLDRRQGQAPPADGGVVPRHRAPAHVHRRAVGLEAQRRRAGVHVHGRDPQRCHARRIQAARPAAAK